MNPKLFICILFIFAGFYFHSVTGATAFIHPATDNAQLWMRWDNPSYLKNDYFTNALLTPNARDVFSYSIYYAGKFLGGSWYFGLYFLKIAIVSVLPTLWFLFLTLSVERLLNTKIRSSVLFLTALIIYLFMWPRFQTVLSMAWWIPLSTHPVPMNVSLLFILSGAILFLNDNKFAATSLYFIGTLFHPSEAILFSIFMVVIFFKIFPLKQLLVSVFFGFVLPALFLAIVFRSNHPLSAELFHRYYVDMNHPFHYKIDSLGTYGSYDWRVYFSGAVVVLFALSLLVLKKHGAPLFKIAVFLPLLFIGTLAIQYFFGDVFPIRIVSMLGPTRFWHFTLYLGLWLGLCATTERSFSKENKARIRPTVLFAGFSILLFYCFIASKLTIDNPIQKIVDSDPHFVEWVSKKTQDDDVFVEVADNWWGGNPVAIPVVLKRALFTQMAFPFHEDHFRDYTRRKNLMYGNPEQLSKMKEKNFLIRYRLFFRTLTPEYFIEVSKRDRLDYVIIETEHTQNFRDQTPAYFDQIKTVYKVKDLRIIKSEMTEKIKTYSPDKHTEFQIDFLKK